MSAVVLAVANQKGGVGKTTTTVNLGAALAERGRRILLVDSDPQANLTAALGLPKDGPSTYDLLLGDAAPADIRRQATGPPCGRRRDPSSGAGASPTSTGPPGPAPGPWMSSRRRPTWPAPRWSWWGWRGASGAWPPP